MKNIAILLSGGQDSATCLAKALSQPDVEVVMAYYANYGPRHMMSEFNCAIQLANYMPARFNKAPIMVKVLEMANFVGYGSVDSALTDSSKDLNAPHPQRPDLPASFVPGRNLAMLLRAAMDCFHIGVNEIWTGVCHTDYSGYPDCRQESITALERAIELGMDMPNFKIVTPLMELTKDETFHLANQLGVLDMIIKDTHTGYSGDRSVLYDWGWGPANEEDMDPASIIRRAGFAKYQETISGN